MKGRLRLDEVSDPLVLAAMEAVPREEFVPAHLRAAAYDDRALPIESGQTISQPVVVAYMTAQLGLSPTSRVLEIGTGSGYQAAVLAEIARDVRSIERIPRLAQTAAARLTRLGYERIKLRQGDGAQGWPEDAPFDAIIVTAAAAAVPPALLAQLAPGGRMILPLGGPDGPQVLVLFERNPAGEFARRDLWPVRFVPLL
jgi:protein-L-isoaspartate(D-aspartate) O-methyltransferase